MNNDTKRYDGKTLANTLFKDLTSSKVNIVDIKYIKSPTIIKDKGLYWLIY